MAFSRHFASVVFLVATLSSCGHARTGPAAQGTSPTPLVTAQDIENSPAMTIEQLLMARVPGLTVTRAPDGHFVIHLRGTTTLYGEQEPLIVVNGIALEPMSNNNLSSINPHDIETIEVLRDAVSTAMYGARGANGVIVIRLKRSE
jgi:TonB-dependent SusC/RagA subfamily outer membrane receptor